MRKLLDATTGLVRIASPYITDNDLMPSIKNRVRLLTSLEHMDIVSGATSLQSLRSLIQAKVQCRSFPGLHAKVWIFGDERAVVTSANLTRKALDSNIEVGMQFTGGAVQELTRWFQALWERAEAIDSQKLDKLEQETNHLREDYAALRKRIAAGQRRKVRKLLDKATRFFLCNTRRRYSRGTDEELMRQRRYAAAWGEFRRQPHMGRVEPGDAIFMYAKGVGIIGVGRANGGHEVLQPGAPDRVQPEYNAREWRVPVGDWLAWEQDEDAIPYKLRVNASFLDVSGDRYRELREAVRKHLASF